MTTAVVRKQGNRPSKYKQSILSDLFEMLARGQTIRECCKELDVSWTTLRQWINKDEKLNKQYLQAKHDSVLYTIEDLDTLLEQAKKDPKLNMTKVKLLEIIQKNVHFKARINHAIRQHIELLVNGQSKAFQFNGSIMMANLTLKNGKNTILVKVDNGKYAE